jgi:asparagine synthase (glutamine-hydrolysing)
MCGLLAVWNRDGAPVDVAALRRGVNTLRPRGPDGEGYVLIDTRSGQVLACAGHDTPAALGLPALEGRHDARFDLALGHRRLAILDRSPAGHQPMSTEDGTLWLVFNGTIYNFAEVRSCLEASGQRFRSRTDTEVVLRAYAQWGTECVERLHGMWAFALWDGRRRRLFVSRDRLGIKPLVYHLGPTTAAFSSELKGLRAFASTPTALDAEALHHYFSLMSVPAPFTVWEGVRKLPPGHAAVVDAKGMSERAWWRIEPRPAAGSADELCEELQALLTDSVRRHLVGDVPVGSLLSGGVDSSIVSALAAAATQGSRLPTYTMSLPGARDRGEAGWAERVATHLSTEHREVPLAADVLCGLPAFVASCDEPFAVSSALGVHALARAASARVKVLLSGDGGDELFAGYLQRYAGVDALWDGIENGTAGRLASARAVSANRGVRWGRLRTLGRLAAAARALRRSRDDDDPRGTSINAHKVLLNEAEKRALYTPAWRERTAGISTTEWLRSKLPPPTSERLTRWQLHDVHTSLPDEMLVKLDKATMACGIEARVPLLDHRIVELALGLPARLKIAEGRGKWILKRVAERHVPREVLDRPKAGFDIPLSTWFRDGWRSFVRDTLSPAALRRAGVLAPRTVHQVLANYESRPSFGSAHMVFTLLCFQIWHDAYHGGG